MAITKTDYFDSADSALTQLYAIRAKLGLSDISQDFRPIDILEVPQAIKGFDKSDFCEVFSMYL